MTVDINVLDSILVEVGDFGKYQRRVCFFILNITIVTYLSSVIFVFETKIVNHRCKIIGCDVIPFEFKPVWWTNAIPSENGEPEKCSKYQHRSDNNTQNCQLSDFNHQIEEQCKDFVYETNEISIMHDFNLQCEENMWKLTIVGTLHSIASLVGMPVFGILSDVFGRKFILISGLVLSGAIGLTRSYVNSYTLFVILVCLDAISRSGAYPTLWVIGSELVGPNKRVLVTLLISTAYAFAGVLQGLLAWGLQSWRILLRIEYTLHLLLFFYYWLIPESVRWLLTKKRFSEAQDILKNLAKVNKKSISGENLAKLETYEATKEDVKTNSVSELFKSSILLFRIATSAVCWTCCIFLYYGLTINSVQMSKNSYLDYILSMTVEIPGSIAFIVIDKVGRRKPLATGFFITGLSCIGSIFVTTDLYWLKLCLYLLGKFGISISVSILYAVTTEVFPTPFRSSLLSICGMFGGIGAGVAAQVPLLQTVWKPLPLILYGCSGVLAAFLSLLYPETMNLELPNTIEEAENIGKTN